MNWYLAKVVFRIICGEGDHTPQFDEQLRLIAADDSDEAFYKAQSLGEQEEDVFMNVQQKQVRWKFINVSELYRVSELIDGAELYSRITEADDADRYIDSVNIKAKGIQEKVTHRLLQLL